MGEGTDIRVMSRYIERSGRPWFPIMGEYHFSRDQPDHWETELRKIRSGGVNIVSTYILWILHEEQQGDVRWDGARDLRRFVETAQIVGLDVVIRIGPWAHGETRNGGFPDWLQALPIARRTNDPDYLALVRGWYAQIAAQVHGLFRDHQNPHGPIVGVQVENEIYDQPDHLGTLRDMAEAEGMRASLWTATGWGGAQLPERRVLPVYAGYADAFWEESHTGWPEFGRMHFTFSAVRDDLTVGADLRQVGVDGSVATESADPWPFATCELGGGMPVAYHRRPLVDPEDVAALAHVKLGSGSSWQGYYLFHGGTQVIGNTTTQESQATGYPNDLPVRDYDFFAPIGREGAQRPHFHALRRQHLMLEAFGEAIVAEPAVIPGDGDVRWSVRGDDRRAWLFVNNHQPALAALETIPGVQFHVEMAASTITMPAAPFTLSAGTFACWPIRQRLGGIDAVTATAQPITQIQTSQGMLVVLAATPGVPVEIQCDEGDVDMVSGATAERRDGGGITVTPITAPGPDCRVKIGTTTFVVLDDDTANGVWKGHVAGRERIVIWDGEGWFDETGFRVTEDPRPRTARVLPALAQGQATVIPVPGADVVRDLPAPVFDDVRTAPVRTGGSAGRFSAPADVDVARLPSTHVDIRDEWFDEAERLLLEITWTGDVMRVYAGDTLIADQFWSGRPLDVDLLPYRELIIRDGLHLRGFAWAPDSGIHVDPRVRPGAVEPVLEVHGAALRTVRSRQIC